MPSLPLRVDPLFCGCGDCFAGRSVPLSRADWQTIRALFDGAVENASGTELITITREQPAEADAEHGSRRCEVRVSVQKLRTPEEFRRNRDFTERCPNRAEARVWISCPNGHTVPEEVCLWHLDPQGDQMCGFCAEKGLAVAVAIAFAGLI
jgi:hypothetical protein